MDTETDINDPFDKSIEDLQEEYEPIQKPGWGRYVFRAQIAFVFLIGTVYLFGGLYELTFFQETPSDVQAPDFVSVVEGETLTVPVVAYVLQETSTSSQVVATGSEPAPGVQTAGSTRGEAEVAQIVANASEVWDQAAIDLRLTRVEFLSLTPTEIGRYVNQPDAFVREYGVETDGAVRMLFSRTLQGINGVAFRSLETLAVADYTTSFDYRVLAHEIGHILSLGHVSDTEQLMSQGSSGLEIT